jgi:hypothetical protein
MLIFSALGLMLSSVKLVLKVRGSRMQAAGEGCHENLREQKASGRPNRLQSEPQTIIRLFPGR